MRYDVLGGTAVVCSRARTEGDPVTTTQTEDARYHVLLIGIDKYSLKPLRGCVNDIDSTQMLLTGPRVGIPKEHLTRLASPHDGAAHDTTVSEAPATLDNIRAALAVLGTDVVKPTDRVFIFYSGHGARVPVQAGGDLLYREALVPVDFNATAGPWRLLYDFELNRLLGAIAARTTAVTVVLECCNSAGATKDPDDLDATARVLELADLGGEVLRLGDEEAAALGEVRGLGLGARSLGGDGDQRQSQHRTVDDLQVVTACHSHERAWESNGPDGRRHGHFARALLAGLEGTPGDSLREVPWARIWQGVRARVLEACSTQNVWMSGNGARHVIGGPRVDGDIGLGIKRAGPGLAIEAGREQYEIDAGSLALVTRGAKLAVYRMEPPYFPPIGSPGDLNARLSSVLLEVTEARPAKAIARALGEPFEVPPGARARLVEVGEGERVLCAIVPPVPEIVERVKGSPLVEVVGPGETAVQLQQRGDAWVLVDDLHGVAGAPVLCTMTAAEMAIADHLMEQYFYYVLPSRMADACKDLPGQLQLSVHLCPDRDLTADEVNGQGLREAPSDGKYAYDLKSGEKVAIFVRNRSSERLKVALLNAAGSGRVEYLGDEVLEPESLHVFWHRGETGRPFPASTPRLAAAGPGGVPPARYAEQGIDRLIAIGTTVHATDLRYLKLDTRFADVVKGVPLARELDDVDEQNPIADRWTATKVVVRYRQRS